MPTGPEEVCAEAADPAGQRRFEREIQVFLCPEARKHVGRTEVRQQRVDLIGLQRRIGQLRQVAVQTEHRRIARYQVQVGGAGLYDFAQPVAQPVWNSRGVTRFVHGVDSVRVRADGSQLMGALARRKARQPRLRVVEAEGRLTIGNVREPTMPKALDLKPGRRYRVAVTGFFLVHYVRGEDESERRCCPP